MRRLRTNPAPSLIFRSSVLRLDRHSWRRVPLGYSPWRYRQIDRPGFIALVHKYLRSSQVCAKYDCVAVWLFDDSTAAREISKISRLAEISLPA